MSGGIDQERKEIVEVSAWDLNQWEWQGQVPLASFLFFSVRNELRSD